MAASTSLGPVCSAITRVHTYRCGALLPMEAKLSNVRLWDTNIYHGCLFMHLGKVNFQLISFGFNVMLVIILFPLPKMLNSSKNC